MSTRLARGRTMADRLPADRLAIGSTEPHVPMIRYWPTIRYWPMTHARPLRVALAGLTLVALTNAPAYAYIGPGAGFAAAGSLLVLVGTFFMALGVILLWPLKAVVKLVARRGKSKAKVKRVIVLGLDGFDPDLARRYADRMPNLARLAAEGCHSSLATSLPSISPVAWSTFATGVDASRHNIYDFLTRDPCSYMPVLSSTDTRTVPRHLNLGFAEVPFGQRAVYKLLQKSQPFWKLLGAEHVWSSIVRVPITWPPQKFKNGTLLSGMCVPDLQGTQGSFSFYTDREALLGAATGGQRFRVTRRNDAVESNLKGPAGKDQHPMKAPFRVAKGADGRFSVTIGKETTVVGLREYTPWMEVPFDGVQGIARLRVMRWDAEAVELYVTPIHIDPESPAMPLSHPFVYSIYLAKMFGKYATLGLAEDTWALNERVIDEAAFLDQAYIIFEERKRQLWDVLDKTKNGFVTVVFDTTDRVSHMFYRYLEPDHPANVGKDTQEFANTIPELYGRADALIGDVMAKVGDDPDTVLMVISDHGFCSFQRGVNLNAWLRDEGYLVLKDGATTSGDWFEKVDWERTRAFTLGLTGVFINRKGRERLGQVEKGPELDRLCHELKRKLEALVDPKSKRSVVHEVFLTREVQDGPYADMAPELLIGYERGFRHSWDCAVGAVSREVFSDNTKSWSGDHCVDPRLVPGVLWCNRKVELTDPSLADIAPTVLDLFGVDVPPYMKGRNLFGGVRARTTKARAEVHA
jgi:predicted AlkP superfamily phosphohydrolase/phosphomutase